MFPMSPQSCSTPSWRIEPKFSTRVLIGNWVEERNKGLPYKNLITHHEEPKHRNLISTYDDHFNRHGYNPLLPPIRTWNGQKLMWLPEKSDFPLLAPPTNYGLFENLQKKWQEPTKIDRATSIYTSSYVRHPVSAMSEQEGAIPALPPPPI
ncbi:cilia- and flagella-associated protein 107-like isoform X2 [Macrotis lagotis]|uniref:cilia- and flagella-associated protein 107-like isoform X2 n=1 Tax=Macrotis lagotis TaxID=92651 RepID=UPI003D6967CF